MYKYCTFGTWQRVKEWIISPFVNCEINIFPRVITVSKKCFHEIHDMYFPTHFVTLSLVALIGMSLSTYLLEEEEEICAGTNFSAVCDQCHYPCLLNLQ